ncbi:MAG: Fur family transcriptional regulator [Candidatus Fimivivens sp.]
MTAGYKTWQRSAILALLKAHIGEHFTADEIATLLQRDSKSVGRATVYRCLERLMAQGCVKKYPFGEGKSACFEYHPEPQPQHYHLKCGNCGALTHLECNYLDKLSDHVYEAHGFELDAAQIVLVGCCITCSEQQRAQQEHDEKAKKAQSPQGDE